jgi:hypothetical protein
MIKEGSRVPARLLKKDGSQEDQGLRLRGRHIAAVAGTLLLWTWWIVHRVATSIGQ